MSREVERRIANLLTQAEEEGSCYAPRGDDAERLRRALQRRVVTGTVVSPWPGLYVSAQTWGRLKRGAQTLLTVRGLQALHPDWVFCGTTAALAYGVDVSHALLDQIHVAVPAERRGSDRGRIRRHGILAPGPVQTQIEVVDGIRVTPPERTVFDSLRWADFPRGLGIVDSALRTGVVRRSELEEFFARSSEQLRGRDRALATLSWADPRSENGGESIVRARILLLGYVCPELQVEVPKVIEGGEPFRADFCWVRSDGLVILGELDGKEKYTEKDLMAGRDLEEVLADENIRGSRFTLYDVSMMRFRFGLTESPERFSALLDEYGVPKRGSVLALPEGARMIPNWEALRRTGGQ